jgi:hypothetical protein
MKMALVLDRVLGDGSIGAIMQMRFSEGERALSF